LKKQTIYSLAVVAGVMFCGVALAQTATPKANSVAHCAVIAANVDKRITNFENQKEKHVAQYKKTQAKVTDLVTRLETKGYDVTQLKVDLVIYNEKIVKFGNDYTAYIADLTATKDYTCGRSEGEFKAELAITRTQLKLVHDDSVAIKTYWSQTLKPEILTLKGTE